MIVELVNLLMYLYLYFTEGIQMLGYQRIGTIHLPRPRERVRAGSDPTNPTYTSSKDAASALINGVQLGDRNNKLLK